MIYREDLNKAIAQKKGNNRLVKRLKAWNSSALDGLFRAEHDEVFNAIDCLSCANCCKTTSPIFRDVDIKRLSLHLKMTEVEFIERYLKMDNDGDYVLQSSPCAFLKEDNTCSVYAHRPLACKEYPHTDRKKMVQILSLTRKNTEICPAVARIFNRLQEKV
jgi:Fe-S-cluster containining protein